MEMEGEMVEMKSCIKCKKNRPVTTDYFFRIQKNKDNLRNTCRKCEYEYKHNNLERNNKCKQSWLKRNPQSNFIHVFTAGVHRSLTDVGRNDGQKWQDVTNGQRWQELFYSNEDLIRHVESQFTEGMGWGNYGMGVGYWEMHHIKPISSFRFEYVGDQEFLECWALGNLIPLWFEDHRKRHTEMREEKNGKDSRPNRD